MQQRLFDPLGMKDTTCWPDEEHVWRLHEGGRGGIRRGHCNAVRRAPANSFIAFSPAAASA
jgi:CubicO group peptidase (beta-lactamase class C family)